MSRAAGGATAAAPARLLVVDDNETNRDLLSRRLRRLGHDVAVAENGREALARLSAGGADLVLLDVMMPELDGYEVLERLKADPELRDVPVIMVSALDEMSSVVRCIELGAEDYLPKPFDPVLLKARVGACLEKKRLRDRERLHAQSLERELEIGRQIQAGFFPDGLPQPAGWEVDARFRAARQVAGDFYDAFPLAGGRLLGLVIADVCDKGVGAALFMALFRSLIRAVAGQDYALGASILAGETGDADGAGDGSAQVRNAIAVTNDYIARTHGRANMFATVFFGVLDPARGSLVYVNGGHEPPLVLGSAGVRARLAATGPAVGLFPDVAFGLQCITLQPGEVLLAYTDGVTEARGPTGGFFGEQALQFLLAPMPRSARALLDRIEDALRVHTAGADPSDDITMLAVRRAADPHASAADDAAERLGLVGR